MKTQPLIKSLVSLSTAARQSLLHIFPGFLLIDDIDGCDEDKDDGDAQAHQDSDDHL